MAGHEEHLVAIEGWRGRCGMNSRQAAYHQERQQGKDQQRQRGGMRLEEHPVDQGPTDAGTGTLQDDDGDLGWSRMRTEWMRDPCPCQFTMSVSTILPSAVRKVWGSPVGARSSPVLSW